MSKQRIAGLLTLAACLGAAGAALAQQPPYRKPTFFEAMRDGLDKVGRGIMGEPEPRPAARPAGQPIRSSSEPNYAPPPTMDGRPRVPSGNMPSFGQAPSAYRAGGVLDRNRVAATAPGYLNPPPSAAPVTGSLPPPASAAPRAMVRPSMVQPSAENVALTSATDGSSEDSAPSAAPGVSSRRAVPAPAVTAAQDAPPKVAAKPTLKLPTPSPAATADAPASSAARTSPTTTSRSLQDRLSTGRTNKPAPASAPVIEEPAPVAEIEPEPLAADSGFNQDAPAQSPAALPKLRPFLPSKRVAAAVESPAPRREEQEEFVEDSGLRQGLLSSENSPVLTVQTLGPKTIKVGQEATYKVRMHNRGGAAAENVNVTIGVPDWAEIAGSSTTAGSAEESDAAGRQLVKWSIPRLEAASHEDISVRIVPQAGKAFELDIQWTHSPIKSRTAVKVQEPRLELDVQGPAEVPFGVRELYRLVISNPGTGDAENVQVRLFPPGKDDAPSDTQRLGTLKAGESQTLELELTARQSGTLSIRAEVSADGGLRDSANSEVLVRRAELAAQMRGPEFQYAGTNARYEISVSNPGNAAAEDVQVEITLPPAAKYVDGEQPSGELVGDKVRFRIAKLAPGEQRDLAFECQLNQPGANAPRASVLAKGDLRATAAAETNVDTVADLVLAVRDPRGPLPVGQVFTYEISVQNRGTRAAKEIDLQARFSEGLEVVSVDGRGHEIVVGRVGFRSIDSLEVGDEVVYRVKARALHDGSHNFAVQLRSEPTDTTLTCEESTRFFGAAIAGAGLQPMPDENLPEAAPETGEAPVRSLKPAAKTEGVWSPKPKAANATPSFPESAAKPAVGSRYAEAEPQPAETAGGAAPASSRTLRQVVPVGQEPTLAPIEDDPDYHREALVSPPKRR